MPIDDALENLQENGLVKRLKDYAANLNSKIEAESQRPYKDKEDIERNLAIYTELKNNFLKIFPEVNVNEVRRYSKIPQTIYELALPNRTKNALSNSEIENID